MRKLKTLNPLQTDSEVFDGMVIRRPRFGVTKGRLERRISFDEFSDADAEAG
jgi:hypothetical protein